MIPRRLFRKARTVCWLIYGGSGILAVSAICLTVVMLMRIDFEARSKGLWFAAARLEQAVGYGGLIHNFKNAVLRGAREPGFAEAAARNVKNARMALEQVDRIQQALGLGASLAAQRAAIDAYESRLAVVAEMHEEGRPVREIDEAVRYDDQHALEALVDLHTRISALIDYRLMLLRVASAILTVTALGGALMSFVGPMIVRLRRRNCDLEAFTALAANDLLGPLRRIRGMSEIVAEEASRLQGEEARLRTTARAIFATAASLERAFTGTLDYMRAGSPSSPREVNLVDLLTNLGHLCTPPPAKLTIVEPMPVIEAPVPEIELVLRHLLEFAVERHPDRAPYIEVSYGRTDRGHRITIIATGGAGLEADRHVPRDVVRPGLRLLRSIVDDWGGSVEVDRDPGDGVVIDLNWPL